jgi:hypothetical protein
MLPPRPLSLADLRAIEARLVRAELESILGPEVSCWPWSLLLSRWLDALHRMEDHA